MERETYLIPANSKRGLLIFNAFTSFDLILFGIGFFITIILIMAFPPALLLYTILELAPALIAGFLVMPVPNYHNVLVVLTEAIQYLTDRQRFIWKGWQFNDGIEKEQKK